MLYENEDQYNDAREYYEGSDLDNWENEQVFQDREYDDEDGDEWMDEYGEDEESGSYYDPLDYDE